MEWWSDGGSRFEGQGVLLPGNPGSRSGCDPCKLKFCRRKLARRSLARFEDSWAHDLYRMGSVRPIGLIISPVTTAFSDSKGEMCK